MSHSILFNWNVSAKEARLLQAELAEQVIFENRFSTLKYIAGLDVLVQNDVGRAGVVVMDYETLQLVDMATAIMPISFPYRPGLLAFREGPIIMEAFARLEVRPDLLIFDGNGVLHPRRVGLASHIGVLLDLPSIGCAKNLLLGTPDDLGPDRGDYALIRADGEVVGAAVRTQTNVKPIYVSIGHKIDLETSIAHALHCAPKYRLPETTRLADRISRGMGGVIKGL